MTAKLIFYNVPSSNVQNSLKFYSALLGIDASDFVRAPSDQTESYNYLISPDGIELHISSRHHPNEGVTPYYAVDDLNAALNELERLGAKVDVKPSPVQVAAAAMPAYQAEAAKLGQKVTAHLGQFAIVRDPDNNMLGLMQLEDAANRYFKSGPYRNNLSAEQLAALQGAKRLGQQIKS